MLLCYKNHGPWKTGDSKSVIDQGRFQDIPTFTLKKKENA